MKRTHITVATILLIVTMMLSSCSHFTTPADAAGNHNKCGRTVR